MYEQPSRRSEQFRPGKSFWQLNFLKLSQKSRPTAPLCLKCDVHHGLWMSSFSCLFAYFHATFLKFSPFNSDSVGCPGVCQPLERHLTHKRLSSFHWLAFLDDIWSHFPLHSRRFRLPSTGWSLGWKQLAYATSRDRGERTLRSAGMFFPNISKRQLLRFATEGNKSLLDTLGLSNSSRPQTQPVPLWLAAIAPTSQACWRAHRHGAFWTGAWTSLFNPWRRKRNFKGMFAKKKKKNRKESCYSLFSLQNDFWNPMFGEPLMVKRTQAEGK